MPTDPHVDAHIVAQPDFAQPILRHIRARVHAACPEAVETLKWGKPFFDYKGRPLAMMAAFKAHASFGFWRRDAVATGQEGEAMGQFGRLTSIGDLPDDAEFERLVKAAMALIDAGVGRLKRAPKPEADVPLDLAHALADDDAATATFNAFPPSCRRDYCEWVSEAKRPETRAKRVTETIVLLRDGKRRNWKYEAC